MWRPVPCVCASCCLCVWRVHVLLCCHGRCLLSPLTACVANMIVYTFCVFGLLGCWVNRKRRTKSQSQVDQTVQHRKKTQSGNGASQSTPRHMAQRSHEHSIFSCNDAPHATQHTQHTPTTPHPQQIHAKWYDESLGYSAWAR